MSCQTVANTDISSLLPQVFTYLDKKDLLICSRVSTQWQKASGDNAFWSRFYPGAEIPKLFGVTLKDHLYMVSKMFPMSKFPEIWDKICTAPEKAASTFNDDKASFVDGFSKDGTVSIAEGQTWDLLEIEDDCTIDYPQPTRRTRLAQYLLSFFISVKH